MEANKYTQMQRSKYEENAGRWSITNRDPVVGSFDSHNNWEEYEYLFANIGNSASDTPDALDAPNKFAQMRVLDFGCGPGRNIVKYNGRFRQIDGADISAKNLENAVKWMLFNRINPTNNLYLCNGYNLENITGDIYDLVISTIVMQHICVYDIRKNYFREFYRILKDGGFISIQMGFGIPEQSRKNTVSYYTNNYDATGTNGQCDVAVSNPNELKQDLAEIGFRNFRYIIGKTGPGDSHPAWIYFSAQK
jgi:SAM-dependent methyltransferase